MKALTINQPWPWAILNGYKLAENRTWRTDYRGVIAIHAGKSRQWMGRGVDFIEEAIGREVPEEQLAFGAILGLAELHDCAPFWAAKKSSDKRISTFAEGPWCWLLRNPRWLPEPIPYSGKLGLFDVPDLSLTTGLPIR